MAISPLCHFVKRDILLAYKWLIIRGFHAKLRAGDNGFSTLAGSSLTKGNPLCVDARRCPRLDLPIGNNPDRKPCTPAIVSTLFSLSEDGMGEWTLMMGVEVSLSQLRQGGQGRRLPGRNAWERNLALFTHSLAHPSPAFGAKLGAQQPRVIAPPWENAFSSPPPPVTPPFTLRSSIKGAG